MIYLFVMTTWATDSLVLCYKGVYQGLCQGHSRQYVEWNSYRTQLIMDASMDKCKYHCKGWVAAFWISKTLDNRFMLLGFDVWLRKINWINCLLAKNRPILLNDVIFKIGDGLDRKLPKLFDKFKTATQNILDQQWRQITFKNVIYLKTKMVCWFLNIHK